VSSDLASGGDDNATAGPISDRSADAAEDARRSTISTAAEAETEASRDADSDVRVPTATDQRLRDPRAAQGVVARSLVTPATLVQGEQASRVVMPLCALASGLGLLIACRAL
jgi:hypothetical protein